MGGVRPAAARAVAHARRQPARARRDDWRCATPATSTPAGRRACRSGWCRPPRSPRPARTRRTRSSTRPPTRSTGTRRSTTVPDGVAAPVTDDSSTYVLRLGDDALIAAQRLAEWCSRAPEMEEDIALANIALDQLGAARLLLTLRRGARGRGPRRGRRSPSCATTASSATACWSSCPTATSRVTHGASCCSCRRTSCALRPRWSAGADERLAGDRRQGAQGVARTTSTTLHCGRCGSATAPRSRTAGCRPPSTSSGRTRTSCSSDDPVAAAGRPGDAARRRGCPPWTPVLRRGDADRPADGWAPDRRPRRACTPSTCAYLLAEMQVLHRAHPGATW